jgi:hypothetical protein
LVYGQSYARQCSGPSLSCSFIMTLTQTSRYFRAEDLLKARAVTVIIMASSNQFALAYQLSLLLSLVRLPSSRTIIAITFFYLSSPPSLQCASHMTRLLTFLPSNRPTRRSFGRVLFDTTNWSLKSHNYRIVNRPYFVADVNGTRPPCPLNIKPSVQLTPWLTLGIGLSRASNGK